MCRGAPPVLAIFVQVDQKIRSRSPPSTGGTDVLFMHQHDPAHACMGNITRGYLINCVFILRTLYVMHAARYKGRYSFFLAIIVLTRKVVL